VISPIVEVVVSLTPGGEVSLGALVSPFIDGDATVASVVTSGGWVGVCSGEFGLVSLGDVGSDEVIFAAS
jgi:hypothetical protein